ncbi:MAG: hypothetical protein AB1486_16875 [Planctomycetota bacterium]
MTSAPIPVPARWIGAGVVMAAAIVQAFWLGLPAVLLSAALLVSFGLWIASPWHVGPQLRTAFGLAILVFIGHAVEEYLTGFHEVFPPLFGGQLWSGTQYLAFNGVWALIFCTAAVTLRPGRPLPALIILFFAVAGGVGNGVLHFVLVFHRGTYFPGAWTALLCLGAGAWLLWLLFAPGRHLS